MLPEFGFSYAPKIHIHEFNCNLNDDCDSYLWFLRRNCDKRTCHRGMSYSIAKLTSCIRFQTTHFQLMVQVTAYDTWLNKKGQTSKGRGVEYSILWKIDSVF